MHRIGSKKTIKSWAFYDWANSIYSLVISTSIFPLYYGIVTENKSVYFFGVKWEHPEALYNYALSFSFLVVAFISPILSGIADYTGNKKQFLKFFCWMGALSVMSLYFFEDTDSISIGIWFTILASIGFWASLVFYNAYLPEVALPEQQDRASAKGFIYGYVGSVVLLLICLGMILPQETKEDKLIMMRYSFVIVGIWWVGFAYFTFHRLPNNIYDKKPDNGYIWKGFRELKVVFWELKNYTSLRKFLVSFFLLSIGVQTIILTSTIFGSKELGLDSTSMIITVLLVQIVAIFGAFLFSRISEKFGNIRALKITLAVWTLVCFCAFLLDKNQENVDVYFFGLGGLLGFVLGAIQSLTRSTYSKLLPDTQEHAIYFSFYDVTEKIAIVLGTFVYGLLYAITSSMQWSVLCLAIFFLISFVILSTLKKTKYVA